jgi:hypothetical protein
MSSFLTSDLVHPVGDFKDLVGYGDYLGRQVVHAYNHPTEGFLMWDLPIKRVEALVSPRPAYESSILVSARSIGMKDAEFKDFAILSRRLLTLSGKESLDPTLHSPEHIAVTVRIKEQSGRIHAGLKAYLAAPV